MSFKRSANPQTVPNAKVRQFDGIGGPQTQVLRRSNDKGWDISNTVANDVKDLHLSERGSAFLRPGMRRLGSEDYTIGWIGQMNIGGLLRYGIIYNNSLEMIDMPSRLGYELIPWPKDDPIKPSDWPVGWHFYPWEPVNESIPEDPSMPLDEQVCIVGYEWSNSPTSGAFTMPYAGTISPTSINWYEKNTGYRPDIPLVGCYNAGPAWLGVELIDGISLVLGPCLGEQIGGIEFTPDGKDIDDNWLVPGIYAFTSVLTWSDGEVMSFPITLTVAGPEITLTPESDDLTAYHLVSGNETSVVSIENSGGAGSILNWENTSITGDAVLVAIMSLDTSSGTLAKSASENVTITLADPGDLAVGSYSAVVNFIDSKLATVTDSFTVNLVVSETPSYTGSVSVHAVLTISGTPTESDATALYRAGPAYGFEPLWYGSTPVASLVLKLGKLVDGGTWVVQYQDQPFWDQCGYTSYRQPITSFNANGCPTGSYFWDLSCPGLNSTRTLTFSEPP